jgi:hypothetical protein
MSQWSLYWFYYTISHGLLGLWDVVFGLLYLFLFIGVFMLKIGYGVLKESGFQVSVSRKRNLKEAATHGGSET